MIEASTGVVRFSPHKRMPDSGKSTNPQSARMNKIFPSTFSGTKDVGNPENNYPAQKT